MSSARYAGGKAWMCVSIRPAPACILAARDAASLTTGLSTAWTNFVTYWPILVKSGFQFVVSDPNEWLREDGETAGRNSKSTCF